MNQSRWTVQATPIANLCNNIVHSGIRVLGCIACGQTEATRDMGCIVKEVRARDICIKNDGSIYSSLKLGMLQHCMKKHVGQRRSTTAAGHFFGDSHYDRKRKRSTYARSLCIGELCLSLCSLPLTIQSYGRGSSVSAYRVF